MRTCTAWVAGIVAVVLCAAFVGPYWSGSSDLPHLVLGQVTASFHDKHAALKLKVLQRMLRRSRAKLEHDTERLKMQDSIAHLREKSLLRLLGREKATLHSRQEWTINEDPDDGHSESGRSSERERKRELRRESFYRTHGYPSGDDGTLGRESRRDREAKDNEDTGGRPENVGDSEGDVEGRGDDPIRRLKQHAAAVSERLEREVAALRQDPSRDHDAKLESVKRRSKLP